MCARGCEKNAQLCKANLCTLGMMMMMGIIIIIQKFQKIQGGLEGWGNGSEYGVVPLFVEALEKFELQLSKQLTIYRSYPIKYAQNWHYWAPQFCQMGSWSILLAKLDKHMNFLLTWLSSQLSIHQCGVCRWPKCEPITAIGKLNM